MSPTRESILFARNLFLPEDLGGNRYPYETIRRLGQRGHPVTVVTPRLHGRFPQLAGVRYQLYPVQRPHPSVSHVSNLLGATIALKALKRRKKYDVTIAGSYDVALALFGVGPVARGRARCTPALHGGDRATRLCAERSDRRGERIFGAADPREGATGPRQGARDSHRS